MDLLTTRKHPTPSQRLLGSLLTFVLSLSLSLSLLEPIFPPSPCLSTRKLTDGSHISSSHSAEKSHLDAFLQTLALSHNSNAALAAYASAGRDQGLNLGVGGVVGVLGEEGEPWQEVSIFSLHRR